MNNQHVLYRRSVSSLLFCLLHFGVFTRLKRTDTEHLVVCA